MGKTRLYTREEVREKVAAATLFSFDRGVRAKATELAAGAPKVAEHPLYVNIVGDMYSQLGLDD